MKKLFSFILLSTALAITIFTSSGLAFAATVNSTTLSMGSSGNDVKILQAALNQKIGAGLTVDGNFGSLTEQAVKDFQQRNNITVSGVAGPDTLKLLGIYNVAADPCGTGIASPIAGLFSIHFCSFNDALMAVAKILLSIVGLTSVVFIMIGGYRYMFSVGNEEQAKKGRDTLVGAVVGLVIAIFAYSIITIVTGTIKSGVNPTDSPSTSGSSSSSGTSGGAGGFSSSDPKLQTIQESLSISAKKVSNSQYTYDVKANGLYSDLVALCSSKIQRPSGARVIGFVMTIKHHVKLPDIVDPFTQEVIPGDYQDTASVINFPIKQVAIIGNAFAFETLANGSAPILAGEDNSQVSFSGTLNVEGGAASCPIPLQKDTTGAALMR